MNTIVFHTQSCPLSRLKSPKSYCLSSWGSCSSLLFLLVLSSELSLVSLYPFWGTATETVHCTPDAIAALIFRKAFWYWHLYCQYHVLLFLLAIFTRDLDSFIELLTATSRSLFFLSANVSSDLISLNEQLGFLTPMSINSH